MAKKHDKRLPAEIKLNKSLNAEKAADNAQRRKKRVYAHATAADIHERFGLTFSQCVHMLMSSPVTESVQKAREVANRTIGKRNYDILMQHGSEVGGAMLKKEFTYDAWRELLKKHLPQVNQ